MRRFVAVYAIAIGICGMGAVPVLAQQTPTPSPTPVPRPAPSEERMPIRNGMEFNTYRESNFDNMLRDRFPEGWVGAYGDAGKVADCLYKVEGGNVSALVGGPLSDDPEYSKLMSAMDSHTKCRRGDRRALGLLIGASLAEKSVLGSEQELPPRALSLNMDIAEPFYTPTQGSATIDHVGRCVAVFSPGLAANVLKTKVGSESEKKALSAAYRATPECGIADTPEGVPAALQRAAIAYGLDAWLRESEP